MTIFADQHTPRPVSSDSTALRFEAEIMVGDSAEPFFAGILGPFNAEHEALGAVDGLLGVTLEELRHVANFEDYLAETCMLGPKVRVVGATVALRTGKGEDVGWTLNVGSVA